MNVTFMGWMNFWSGQMSDLGKDKETEQRKVGSVKQSEDDEYDFFLSQIFAVLNKIYLPNLRRR